MFSLHFRAMRQSDKYKLLIFIVLAHEFKKTDDLFDLLLYLRILHSQQHFYSKEFLKKNKFNIQEDEALPEIMKKYKSTFSFSFLEHSPN